ncbi:hypothetical protein [Bacillus massilioanorexius]|nr:hypothetical protein [Bacillus massilioanorexius]
MLVFILGIVMLSIGLTTNNKWLKLLSIIPFAITVWQLISLFLNDL